MTELYRELGCFDEVATALWACTEDDLGVTSKLQAKMTYDRTTAPVRYKMGKDRYKGHQRKISLVVAVDLIARLTPRLASCSQHKRDFKAGV